MKIVKFGQGSNEVRLCTMERCVRSIMMPSVRAFRSRWGGTTTLVCLEDGSVIFEAKDRTYDPVRTEEFLER